MQEQATALVLGEALIDVVEQAGKPVQERVGGSPLNVAVGLARLGMNSALATWIGADTQGQAITDVLAENHVELIPGSQAARKTSVAHARIDAAGHPEYDFQLEWDLPAIAVDREFDVVHTGSIATVLNPGAVAVWRALRAYRGRALVTFDPNVRPQFMGSPQRALEKLNANLVHTDVVKVSDEDLAWLAQGNSGEKLAASWLQNGPRLVIITRGEKGSQALTASGIRISVPAYQTSIVDTVGAGDAYMGGLLTGLAELGARGRGGRARLNALSERELRDLMLRGSKAAAICLRHVGAYTPTAAEIAEF